MKKVFKSLFLMFFAILFILVIVVMQLSFTINNRIFSSRYFNNVFNIHITAKNIEVFINDLVENIDQLLPSDSNKDDKSLVKKPLSKEEKERMDSIKESFKNNINVEWFKTEIPNFVKGSFGYIVDDENLMPVLNIKLIKTSAKNILTDQNIFGPQDSSNNFDITTMKDELDFNVLFKNIYGSNNNPITSGKNMINNIRVNFIITLILVFASISSIILLISFNVKKSLRWFGSLFTIGGILSLVSVYLYKINSSIVSNMVEKISKDGMDLSFVREWVLSYIKGISTYITIQGICILLLGIGLIIYSIVLAKRELYEKLTKKRRVLLRIFLVLLLIGFITLIIFNFIGTLKEEVDQYNNLNKASSAIAKKTNINQALGKTLNTNFFDLMGDN